MDPLVWISTLIRRTSYVAPQFRISVNGESNNNSSKRCVSSERAVCNHYRRYSRQNNLITLNPAKNLCDQYAHAFREYNENPAVKKKNLASTINYFIYRQRFIFILRIYRSSIYIQTVQTILKLNYNVDYNVDYVLRFLVLKKKVLEQEAFRSLSRLRSYERSINYPRCISSN